MMPEITVAEDILATLSAAPAVTEVDPVGITDPVARADEGGEPGFLPSPPAEPGITPDAIHEVPPPEIPPAAPAASDTPPLIVPSIVEPTIEETLRAEIARLSTLVTSGQLDSGTTQVYPPASAPVLPTAPITPVTPVTVEQANPMQAIMDALTQGFLTQDELDSVIDQPELINEAYSRSSKKFVENIFAILPQLVNQSVSAEIQKNKLVTTFYEMYGDLKPYGDFVRLNMAEIEKVNPTKTYKEIFEETATVCRKRLGLKESTTLPKVEVQPDGKPLPPAFAGSKGNSGKPSGSVKPKEWFDENAADIMNLPR
jgi:hypothetical protein